MDRTDAIRAVKDLEEITKKEIPIMKFELKPEIAKEVVEAYITPLPTSVKTKYGKDLQVNKGNWVVIHKKGGQDAYTPDEFAKRFKPVVDERGK